MSWDIPAGGFDTYREAAAHMRRPFTAEAVRWKVQSTFGPKDNPSGGLIVGYIDARLVVERLNLLVPHLWQATYTMTDRLMWCHLTVDGITRSDVGESSKPGMSKDLVSDALKRAAVHFGVGVSIYAVPQARLFLPKNSAHIEVKGQKKQLFLKDEGHAALKKRYAKWLGEHGNDAFGPALSHGDIEPAIDPPEEAQPETVVDPLEKLRDDARRGYDALCKATPGGAAVEYFPANFQADLAAAQDEDALKGLIARVDELVQRARVATREKAA